MMALSPPFPDTKWVVIAVRVGHEGLRPEIPPHTPQLWRSIIGLCWHDTGEERPSFAALLEQIDDARRGVSL